MTQQDDDVLRTPAAEPPVDYRVQATERVWKYGVIMLAVSLPFILFGRILLLPVYIVLLAGLATIAIWMFGGQTVQRTAASRREKRLMARLDALEERLSNVETLTRVEMQFARRDQNEAVNPSGATPPPPVAKGEGEGPVSGVGG